MGVLVIARLERKISAGIQQRIGPGYAGPLGIIQASADGVKPLSKEDIIPSKGDPLLFNIGPATVITPVLMGYSVIPSGHSIVLADLGTGVIYRIATSSIAPPGPPMTGYGSNNKYSSLGGLRAAAQSTSYEIPSASCVSPISLSSSLSTVDTVEAQSQYGFWGWNLWRQPIGFVAFPIPPLAECERLPFDLPEAEEELAAGHQTEYPGIKSGLSYVAPHPNPPAPSSFATVPHPGGWNPPIMPPALGFGHPGSNMTDGTAEVIGTAVGMTVASAKVHSPLFVTITARRTSPRVRMDQPPDIGRKSPLPIAPGNLSSTASLQLLNLSST
uniref:NADH-plastoquinone oxidoreductase subunit 1 n=1 Tax=Selaginella doederleinii TaxID=186426 RepID=A0A482CHW1_9TRAC|nr:NADH-plastoquinone oxidoreductase subunit 1 [Selaginella doederleinii]QBL76072.1 NADH-plastoquinone oxidoreductase subunit 1 [Selaginella doederleinii]